MDLHAGANSHRTTAWPTKYMQAELPTSFSSATPRDRTFRLPRMSSWSRTWRRLGFFLLPTFVQSHLYVNQDATRSKSPRPTAWLDGLRGIAAFLVFMDHLAYSNFDVYVAWGTDGARNLELLKLPLIRAFYNGAFMVSIFFVISGYALSYKTVRLMRSRDWDELLRTMSSSVFRRAIRLFVPCIASTLMILLFVRLGLYEWTRDIAGDAKRLPFSREHHPWRYDTISEQLMVWLEKMQSWMNPFMFDIKHGDGALDIDGHLWTIPVEFKASIVLFVTQLGVACLCPVVRKTIVVGLMAWTHQVGRWDILVFYAGFLFAELDIGRQEARQDMKEHQVMVARPPAENVSLERTRHFWTVIYLVAFLAGVYLGGYPQRNANIAPGWKTLDSLIPASFSDRNRYWSCWGAFLLVWSVSNAEVLQRLFCTAPAQYLGRISFSLYLVHAAVIHTLGYGVMSFMWQTSGRTTSGFCIAAVCAIVIAIWLADIFMRVIDEPTVRLARWCEHQCIR
ncbi:hypothetical protein E4T43_00001 [Aureobasidium subglaciale]|nr:hypothetical protein E4T43_00001 [Aureobasidium subglaciale]